MTNLNANLELCQQKIFETLLSCAAVIPSVCSKCFAQETRIYCVECTNSKHLCLQSNRMFSCKQHCNIVRQYCNFDRQIALSNLQPTRTNRKLKFTKDL